MQTKEESKEKKDIHLCTALSCVNECMRHGGSPNKSAALPENVGLL